MTPPNREELAKEYATNKHGTHQSTHGLILYWAFLAGYDSAIPHVREEMFNRVVEKLKGELVEYGNSDWAKNCYAVANWLESVKEELLK